MSQAQHATLASAGGDGPGRTTAQAITRAGVVAILRAPSAARFAAVAEVLVGAGVRVIEVTFTSDGALTSLADLVRAYSGQQDVLIGAGTIVTADQAEAAVDAGAQFLVSPVASPDVIAAAKMAHVAAFPGALTPTEIFMAHHSGADGVKIFPASAVPPRYLADVHAPLPGIPLIPTGGIGIDDVGSWIAAGAAAVGLGGALLGDACDGKALNRRGLGERARRSLRAVTAARSA